MGSPRKLSHYRMAVESAAPSDVSNWPTAATSGWTSLPLAEVSLETVNEETGREHYTNDIDRQYIGITAQNCTGGMTTELWPDNAELLLDFGLKRSSDILDSYTIQSYDAGNNESLEYRGVMVNQVTISASESDKELTLAMDMIAQGEFAATAFDIGSLPTSQSFLFADATFTLFGASELKVTAFTITNNNNLAPGPHIGSSRLIRWCDTGVRNVEVNVTVVVNDNTYRTHLRNRHVSGAFVATFNYPGTGSPADTLVFTIAKMNVREATHEGGVNDIVSCALTGTAAKTASAAAIVYAVT